LIEGQPGAGKTTFLRLVACMLARDMLAIPEPSGSSWRRRHLGLSEPAHLPVLIRIALLLPTLDGKGKAERGRLLDYLAAGEEEHGVPREAWEERLERGEAWLLLDGLDEVADPAIRGRLFAIFQDAREHWPGRIVVSSRPTQTADLRGMGFERASIEPFGEAEISRYIDQWVAALHGSSSASSLRGEAEVYRQALLASLLDLHRVRRLASNPVMLTCLCVVHWNEGRLPDGRAPVYNAVLRWLIATRSEQRRKAGFSDPFAWQAFSLLGLAMMEHPSGKQTLYDLDAAAEAVLLAVRRQFPADNPGEQLDRARAWLEFECLGSGILEQLPEGKLRFWHLTFQEYLAALALAWRDDGENKEQSWWPLLSKHLDSAQWRETVELFPGCLLEEGGPRRVDRLLERVLAEAAEGAELPIKARAAAVAARIIRTAEVLEYKTPPEIKRAFEEAMGVALSLFEEEGAARVPVAQRLEVAEALGRGGDPRLESSRFADNLLPVPGLADFRLGKYPVTVEEFQRFVDSDGYREGELWGEWWIVCQKESWEEPEDWPAQLATPNRPVVGVSWYEATAYAAWLQAQRRLTQGGLLVRLPTMLEWEKAATAKTGDYPWGDADPNPELANYDSDIGHPSPVGIYPTGGGPHGHCDLAGNVWEWCGDLEVEEKAFFGTQEEQRYLKGGAWSSPSQSLRSAYRVLSAPDFRYASTGLRLAGGFDPQAGREPGP
jgi:hypothetical protein